MPQGHIPFSPRFKRVLEGSLREALQLGHNYIAPEHLFLGLLRQSDAVAIRVLDELGVNAGVARHNLIMMLSGATPMPTPSESPLAQPERTILDVSRDIQVAVVRLNSLSEELMRLQATEG